MPLAKRAVRETIPVESSAIRPWDLSQPPRIAVARPRLAELSAAMPYLQSIDARRTYSNFGPLNAQFEALLADRYGLAANCVVTCGNATVGLTMALQRAVSLDGGRYCVMPSWTFAATAHAAIAAGLIPYLVDVEPTTGALTPTIAAAALKSAPGPVAAILPVAPFGQPLDPKVWDSFADETGVSVVIDAAAGFDALKPGRAAAVVSLHATKVLGIGEGGFVISTDPEAIADIRRRSNFGFDGSRDAGLTGCNGKISEYAAAFGLAALDMWRLQRLQFQTVINYYRAALTGLPGLRLAPGLGDEWVCSTFNIEAPADAVTEIEGRMAAAGIATRRWWVKGLAGHQAFGELPRSSLPISDRLAAETLGLPCWPGIGAQAMDEVSAIVRGVLKV